MKTPVQPEISVIVPFYNAEQYIRECITGLLSQNYPADAYEIIMIDNNSTDASAEIVKQHPRITLLTEKKQGAYAARNRGLVAARGALMAFTDPDCVPEKDWLRNIAATLSLVNVCVIIGNCQMARDSLSLSLLAAYERHKMQFIHGSSIKELYYGYTNNMAVKGDIFAQLGPFAERARGADSMFIRQVVDKFSCDAVRYETSVRVRHLEMRDAWKYYQKQFIYGHSNRLWREAVVARPLALGERLQVFWRTIQSERYSLPQAALLLLLLSFGAVFYTGGQWSAEWSLRQKTAADLPGETI